MLIAITGATGLIGSALGANLVDAGHEVRALRRGNQAEGGQYDIASDWVAPDALRGADAVVHLAGASIGTARWTTARREAIRSSRVDSTRLLVDAMSALERRPRVFIVASGVGYYGDGGDRVLDESAPIGAGFLASLVRDWEAEAQRASAFGVRVVSARFGVVLSRHGGALRQMALPFRLGAGGPIGSGQQWLPWISLDDTVGALTLLLQDERASGPVNLVAPEPVTNRAFSRTLGQVLRRPSFMPVPAFVLRLALGAGRADELLLAGQRAVPGRLHDLGFAFRHADLREVLTAELRPGAARPQAARP
ncbi:MAG: TIGR01777 family oxidoreductase [Dehalococcoidia bacterium]